MAAAERKPPAVMESRIPKSLRLTPSEWESVEAEARERGLEPLVFARQLFLIALNDLIRLSRREDSLGVLVNAAKGSQRTRRF